MGYYVHGLSYEPLFNVLSKMHYRCENENHSEYEDYGGRGITVCEEWSMDNAQAFISWAKEHGWRKGLQIDRIDNNKGYSPDNCRFVTPKENARNKRNNHHVIVYGEEMLLCEAIEKYSVVSKALFEQRYYIRKMDLEKALFKENGIPYKNRGIAYSLKYVERK